MNGRVRDCIWRTTLGPALKKLLQKYMCRKRSSCFVTLIVATSAVPLPGRPGAQFYHSAWHWKHHSCTHGGIPFKVAFCPPLASVTMVNGAHSWPQPTV